MLSQSQFLSKIISSHDYSLVVKNNLSDDYFFNYKNEFNFIKNHYNAYHDVPDEATFLAHYPDFDYIKDVKESEKYLVEQLLNDYKQAKFAEIFNNAKEKFESGKADISELMHNTAEALTEVSDRNTKMSCTDITADTDERFKRYLDRVNHRSEFYFRTGFKELDDKIGGIDTKNENMVIAARTGIGKTWMLVIMAANAALQQKTVGFYSGEMTVDKVASRIDTILGNAKWPSFTNTAITKGDGNASDNYKKYLDELKEKRKNNAIGQIKILTPKDINGPATVDALSAFVEQEHIDILFVDQYSLLEDTSHAKVEHERVANISKAIKNLQVMKEIPIISVTQNNRTGEKDKDTGKFIQDTTQIALSDRIGQDATVILMLSRKQEKVNDHDQFVINILKSRDGGDGQELVYEADFDNGKMTFIPEAKNKEDAKKMASAYDEDTGEMI